MTRIRSRSFFLFRAASQGIAPLLLLTLQLHAQQTSVAQQIAADRALLAKESYQLPPPEIVKLVTAPRYLNVSLTNPSPDRKHFLREDTEGLPSVTAFGKPHYYFGGLQVDFKANRARSLTTRGGVGLQVIDPLTGKSTSLDTPKGATISATTWSPDGKQLAYIANFNDASHVFVADIATGKSTQITKTPLLATLVTTIDWTADGRSVIAVILPEPRQPEPKRPEIAAGPLVRLWTDGQKDAEVNYASLLQDPFDMALMNYYVTGQLALIDVKARTVRKIGAPGMIQSVEASPDGLYFRVTTMQEPFSYVVQYTAFGNVEQLWDANGKVLAEISKRALRLGRDTTGGGAGRGGRGGGGGDKRSLAWMPQGPGMWFLQQVPAPRGGPDTTGGAAPGAGGGGARGRGARGGGSGAGGAGGAAPARGDRLMQWVPPYGANDTKVLYESTTPISGVVFTDDAKSIFVSDNSGGQGEIYVVDLADPATRHTIVRQRGYTPSFAGGGRAGRGGGGGGRGGTGDDSVSFYTNPGAMMTRRGTLGGQVAMVSSDGGVFLEGTQYYKDYEQNAPRAFVDKVDIKSGAKARVFDAAKDAVETVNAALDDDFSKAVVTRESSTQVADSYLRDMKTGQMTRLTNNKDFSPEFTTAVRKRITVTRADGYHFVVSLTLPPDYRPGTRLPGFFWFYPYEYTDQASYDRTLRTENINRFPTAGPRTLEYLTTQGYAVANFDPPIVGEAGRMNDNYVSDLQNDLIAVIDELDKQGYVDRAKLGIGGHSYGAFSTVNALVHTPYFKAGIAGDGMYNRTLTPDGFQSERRDLWSGQKTYLEMSPMLSADKMTGALLMYHSLEDQNVGTDPISSIRMMQALRANGKTASLFMYPYEDHGPATKESDLDQWARWVAWLDIYVKHAGEWKPEKTPPAAAVIQPQELRP
jgi:dipeptidyl aminopeptidase/acylaminoacyl peptidase